MGTKKDSPMALIREFQLGNEEVNRKLAAYVDREIEKNKGLQSKLRHSNIGGWHSDRELHAKLGDGSELSNLLLQLFASFSAPMNEYIRSLPERFNTKSNENYEWDYTGAWFNVAFRGSYNAPHVHLGSQISAAYYINTEQPTEENPFSGRIDFIHENLQYGFFPKPGTLFLFPSDMLHWVHPYYGSSNRVVLSFNAANIRTV